MRDVDNFLNAIYIFQVRAYNTRIWSRDTLRVVSGDLLFFNRLWCCCTPRKVNSKYEIVISYVNFAA